MELNENERSMENTKYEDLKKSQDFFEEDNINWKNTIEFIPAIVSGKVIKVTDGDTICIACKIPYEPQMKESNQIYRFHIRLFGIDTPEMKSKNIEDRKIANLAKDFLTNLILNQIVFLKNLKKDKYGRIVANVYTKNNENISELMVEKKFAYSYFGKTKEPPKNWYEYHYGVKQENK
jgi:endonuclease YncB( thermonuclease family)